MTSPRTALLLAALCLAPPPVRADAASDAAYIVEQTVTDEIMAGSMQALAPLLASAMESDLRRGGVTINDQGRFLAVVFDEFYPPFVAALRAELAGLYVASFSPRELAEIAAFYRTETGQTLLRRMPGMMVEVAERSRTLGVEVAGDIDPEKFLARLKREGVVVAPAGP